MALPALQMSFAGGIDESTRAELQDPGASWRVLENVRQESPGSVMSRFGFVPQSLARIGVFGGALASRGAGRRVFSHDGAAIVVDGNMLDSFILAGQTNITRGRVPECTYSLQGAPSPGAQAALYDTATCAGYTALSYSISAGLSPGFGQIFYMIVEVSTGEVVSKLISSVTNGYALLASFGDRFFIRFEFDDPTNAITWSVFDTLNIASGWTAPASVVAAAVQSFAVCSLSSRAAIAYGTSSGTDRVTVKTFSNVGLLETRTIATASNTPTVIAMGGSIADTLWVGWDQAAASIKAIGLDADALATTRASAATIMTITGAAQDLDICEGATAGTARMWVTTDSIPTVLMTNGITTSSGAATPGTANTIRNVIPSSRSFQVDGRFYMACFPAPAGYALIAGSANTQALCVIADWTDNQPYFRPVGNIEPGLVSSVTSTGKFSLISTGRYVFGFQITTSGGVGIGAVLGQSATLGTQLLELDFRAFDRWLTASHIGNTFIGGALTTVYDGERLTEVGFLARPTKPSSSLGGTGLTGSFRCVAQYEDIDASGNWVPSGVSDPSDLVSPANKTITWSTQTLNVTYRQIDIATTRVAYYRTLNGGEPPYYRLGVASTVTAAASTYADATDDSDLAEHSLLGGDGNLPSTDADNDGNSSALDKRAPPGFTRLASFEGMLVGSRGRAYFNSGQPVGGEATWFSPVFQGVVDYEIEAMAGQDGTLYFFTRPAIYAVAGPAPSDNGLQGGLGAPRRLALDVGASQWPTCVTSLGIFFVSDRGIEILTRAQTVEYIGERIKETLAAFPIVTAMTFDPESSCVLIELAAATSSGAVSGSGRTIVYDTRIRQWQSVDRRTNILGSADAPAQDACLVWNGSAWRYAWLGVEGRVNVEDHTSHLDPGSAWINARAVSPKMRSAGTQGNNRLQSVALLAERATHHQIRISAAFDDATAWTDVETWTAPEIVALPREQLEIECSREQIMSVQIQIESLIPSNVTATPITTGEGSTWIGLALNIGPNNTRQATTLLPAAHRK